MLDLGSAFEWASDVECGISWAPHAFRMQLENMKIVKLIAFGLAF